MAKRNLIVNVYLDSVANPVEGATVTIKGEGYQKIFKTNAEGKTNPIELDAPEKEYSLTPQDTVRPYSLYDVKATKDGKTTTVKNVEILPGETSLQDVFLKTDEPVDVIDLPEHVLWGDYEPKIPEEPIKEDPNDLTRVLPRVIIPEYIIVHDGTPTSGATNYIVPFIDYIKNVASSEIYSTWHVEAIKANIHAIVSFTLNRIYTEWYPSRGYNFTITSSPAYDQKYTPNRTIFQSIANVVNEYFRYYIRLPNVTQPLLAQYNDGVKTNNSGWLSQWGSQELATAGYKALDILRRYYTSTLTLQVAPEVVGLPVSFPGYNLRVGSCGEAVQKVQIELNRIRGNYPAIPAISPANGQYGESTKKAVEAFQKAFNLPVTGVIDFATWFKISYVFTAVAGLQQGVS